MFQAISHPTKEQVRAYMLERGGQRTPPPAPEEIRRQLGWTILPPHQLFFFSKHGVVLPVKIGQLAALLAVEWLFRCSWQARASIPPCRPPY